MPAVRTAKSHARYTTTLERYGFGRPEPVCSCGTCSPPRNTSSTTSKQPVLENASATANKQLVLENTSTTINKQSVPGNTATATNKPLVPLEVRLPLNPRSPVPQGLTSVEFRSNEQWNEKAQFDIGSRTKKLSFRYNFVLTPGIIDNLITARPTVCRKLTHFVFNLDDVSYGATNSATELDDAVLARLAEACPNLRVVQLQGTSYLSDTALSAFFRNCPTLTHLEITRHSRGANPKLKGTAFADLKVHSDWATGLKILSVDDRPSPSYIRQMRDLSRARRRLKIELVRIR